ncbi:hypothetical protein DL96DRAFT_1825483 [Flagelloscypha sp. PMI_526]|nr:hypothetical protein DL96DRAFT_1825483 [Flagelloscypha sp. PMI_526]
MAEPWSDVFEAKAQVQAILRNHNSFSPKEFIQNTEDAGAKDQVLIYDRRDFSSGVGDAESVLLGPAIVAWNSGVVSQKDWDSLQRMNASNKINDATAIGKFGVGLRTGYMVSDFLQVFSDGHLGILDPAKIVYSEGGCRFSDLRLCQGLVQPFEGLPSTNRKGTFIRFPIRVQKTAKSIIDDLPDVSSVHTLFQNFIREDLSLCLLFLNRLESIEVWEIAPDSTATCLALVSVSRDRMLVTEHHRATRVPVVTKICTQDAMPQTVEWQILHSAFPPEEAVQFLDPSADSAGIIDILHDAKIGPEVSMAIPIGNVHRIEGKLFDSLPLPIVTSFPCHVHGRFLLESSRCHLKNPRDEGSTVRERVLSKWNTVLISQFLPRTWSALLKVLTEFHNVSDIFSAWPQAHTQIDNYHGQSLLSSLIENIVKARSIIWPVFSVFHQAQIGYRSIEDVLVTCAKETKIEDVNALVTCGLRLSIVPEEVYDGLSVVDDKAVRLLTPESAREALEAITPVLEDWSVACLVANYLLSTHDLRLIAGLPVIILSNGQRASLQSCDDAQLNRYLVLSDDTELSLFGPFSESVVVLNRQATELRHPLKEVGPTVLNVSCLSVGTVVEFLDRSPSPIFFNTPTLERPALDWLEMFWVWLADLPPDFKEQLFAAVQNRDLLPSRFGLRIVRYGLFPVHTNTGLVTALESVGVGFLNTRFGGTSRPLKAVLEGFKLMKSWDSLEALSYHMSFGEPTDQSTLGPVLKHVMKKCGEKSVNYELLHEVASWPLFPVVSFIDGIRTCVGEPLSDSGTVTLLTVSEPPPPSIEGMRFLDNCAVDLRPFLGRLGYTNIPTLGDIQILSLAIDNLLQQSSGYKDIILQFMANNRNSIPNGLFAQIHDLDNLSERSASDSSSENEVTIRPSAVSKRLSRTKSHSDLEIHNFVGAALSFSQELADNPDPDAVETALVLFRRFCESSVVHEYLCSDAEQLERLHSLRICHRAPERRSYSFQVLRDRDESTWKQISPTLCSMNEIARTELLPVCWTQRACLLDTSPLPLLVGIPLFTEVVDHLRHLVNTIWPRFRESEVVDDIMQTYKFLTEHVDQLEEGLATGFVQGLAIEPLFLNVDARDTPERYVWQSASDMCFGVVRDAGGLFRVRNSLLGFKPLLLALGADEIFHDPSPRHTTRHGAYERGTVANELRLSQRLCDVKFETNNPDIYLWAHRSELSCNVQHFHDMFTDTTYIESRQTACPADPIILKEEVSSNTLDFILNWIYTQTFPSRSSIVIIEHIDEILYLCDRWDLGTLKELIADTYITNCWMSPVDCRIILEAARKYGATSLAVAGEKFVEVNRRVIEKQDRKKAREA